MFTHSSLISCLTLFLFFCLTLNELDKRICVSWSLASVDQITFVTRSSSCVATGVLIIFEKTNIPPGRVLVDLLAEHKLITHIIFFYSWRSRMKVVIAQGHEGNDEKCRRNSVARAGCSKG